MFHQHERQIEQCEKGGKDLSLQPGLRSSVHRTVVRVALDCLDLPAILAPRTL